MYQRMMWRRSYCLGIATLFAFTAFGAKAATPTPSPMTSGIEGVILVSPSRPGPTRENVPNTAPVANVAFVVTGTEGRAASFTTDADGRFRVSLPPGHYTVARENAGRVGRWRFEAEVRAGEVTKVEWMADSGMR